MGIFRFGAIEAQNWLSQEREVHRGALAAWQGGAAPDDASGRRIAALIDRSNPTTAARIREYCQLMTLLALAAEDALHDQVENSDRVEVEARAAFERVAALKRELGQTQIAALKAVLPFSRNDYWEISELKERLKTKK
jgi:hypothetical protein